MTLDMRDRKGFCIHGHLLMLEDCLDCQGLADLVEARTYAYAEGAAVAFGLLGMAEAIRTRPRYTWKLVQWFRPGGETHSVSWYATEEEAHDAASQTGLRGRIEVTKEELEPRRVSDDRRSDP